MVFDAAKSQGIGGDMYNVITPKNATMFMNMPGMKIRKSIALDQFVKYDNSNKVPSKNDLVKTGNIKSILGFACHEYTYKSNEGTMTFWVTKERFPIEGTFIPMLGMKNNQTFGGFVMELNFTTTTDSSSIKVVKINQNKKLVINTKEYKSMGF
ncbi:MAG: DUF4412 domain-containing protein [Flavobacteriaceae bacterium]|nr:DUF4412 domain-containing protein [Flavobacteriaceae bacterium]